MNGLKDKFILWRIRSKKDAEAYGQIYDQYIGKIYRFIFFKVGKVEEAEDLASEVFLKAWQYINEGKPIRYLNALLYSIARNLVIDYFRQKKLRREATLEDETLENIGDGKDAARTVEIGQEMKTILESLRSLKDEYREVIVMHYIDELGIGEIAEILGKTNGNVRVLLHRAMSAAREMHNIKQNER
ncbi:MAG: RNA polymerase sigma factor [Patescibacteria group bacterium]